jgi:hypothetical protein
MDGRDSSFSSARLHKNQNLALLSSILALGQKNPPERKRELDSRCSLKEEGGRLAQQEKDHGPTNPTSDSLARDDVDPVERAL